MSSNEPSDLNWNTFRTYYVASHGNTSGKELADQWNKYKERHGLISMKKSKESKPSQRNYFEILPKELKLELAVYLPFSNIVLLCNLYPTFPCGDELWIRKAEVDFNMSKAQFLNLDIKKNEQLINVLRQLSLKERYEVLSHKLPVKILKLFNLINWDMHEDFDEKNDLTLSQANKSAGLTLDLLDKPINYLYSVRFSLLPDYSEEESSSFIQRGIPEPYVEFDITSKSPLTPRAILDGVYKFFNQYDEQHGRRMFHVFFEGLISRYDKKNRQFFYEIITGS